MGKRLLSLILLPPLSAGLVQAQVVSTITIMPESYDRPGHFLEGELHD